MFLSFTSANVIRTTPFCKLIHLQAFVFWHFKLILAVDIFILVLRKIFYRKYTLFLFFSISAFGFIFLYLLIIRNNFIIGVLLSLHSHSLNLFLLMENSVIVVVFTPKCLHITCFIFFRIQWSAN